MIPQPGNTVRLPLSAEQQAQITRAIGRPHETDTLELTIEELEERITPKIMQNHNEPLLTVR